MLVLLSGHFTKHITAFSVIVYRPIVHDVFVKLRLKTLVCVGTTAFVNYFVINGINQIRSAVFSFDSIYELQRWKFHF